MFDRKKDEDLIDFNDIGTTIPDNEDPQLEPDFDDDSPTTSHSYRPNYPIGTNTDSNDDFFRSLEDQVRKNQKKLSVDRSRCLPSLHLVYRPLTMNTQRLIIEMQHLIKAILNTNSTTINRLMPWTTTTII